MTLAFDALDAPSSPLAHRDPRWKLAALMLAGIAVIVIQDWRMAASATLGLTLLLIGARLPWRLLRARAGAFAIFLLPFMILLPVTRGRSGVATAAVIGLRAYSLFIIAILMIATTPFHRTMQAAQSMGAPRILTQLVLLSYRYLFVLRDEFVRIRTALRVRGFRAGAARRAYHTIGLVAGSLVLRGDERAERVAQAMRCRGFDGRFRSLNPFCTRHADLVFFLIVAGIAVALVAADLAVRF